MDFFHIFLGILLVGVAIGLARLLRQRAHLKKTLKTLQAQLSHQQEVAKEEEARTKDLVAFLAHDLKTPLTSVVGYLTLLAEKPDFSTSERVKFTGIALEKALRLEELLGEFFDIARMDLQLDIAQGQEIQLSMLLAQLADEFYPLFGEKGLVCTTQIQPQLVVSGDSDKLARVFDNVLRNAVNYSIPGGHVVITAAKEGTKVHIAIANEGMEIPEQELTNIFHKFYRLDAARSTRTGGAGLGLAIAREIVEAHGGTIYAESNGKTATFHIEL